MQAANSKSAGVGGISGGLHNRRVKGLSHEKALLKAELERQGLDADTANFTVNNTIEMLADIPERTELATLVRKSIAGQDRIGAGKLLDKTMHAVTKGEQVDLATWSRELGIDTIFARAESTVAKNVQRQTEYNAIKVASSELGIDDSAPIKTFITKAREIYRGFQKNPIQHPVLGEIKFTGKGIRESSHTGADKRKWKLFPKLQEIIMSAEYKNSEELHKIRKDGITKFHWLESDIVLDDELLRVGIQVAEDSKGNLFYNLNQDLDTWNKKNKPSSERPAQSTAGHTQGLDNIGHNLPSKSRPGELALNNKPSSALPGIKTRDTQGFNQNTNVSDVLNINTLSDNVNMEFLADDKRVGGKDYSVKLTVKEYKDGILEIAENGVKLYHHRLEKEMPTGTSDAHLTRSNAHQPSESTSFYTLRQLKEMPTGYSDAHLTKSNAHQPSASTSFYTLRQLLEDVKDSEDNLFLKQSSTSGQGNDTLFQAAMQRSDAGNLDEFIKASRVGEEKYFVPNTRPLAIEKALDIDSLAINIPSNFIQHLDNRRKNKTIDLVNDTENVLANADVVALTKQSTRGDTYTAIRFDDENNASVVAFILSKSKEKGNRISPVTSYKAKKNSILQEIDRKKRAVTISSASEGSDYHHSDERRRVLTTLNENITTDNTKVKNSDNTNLEQSSNNRVLYQKVTPDIFGNPHTEFKGKFNEGLEHLLRVRKGYIPSAFHLEGYGDVDIPWGKAGGKGFGIAHILERRALTMENPKEFVRALPEIIKNGTVVTKEGRTDRIYVVSKDGGRKLFLG